MLSTPEHNPKELESLNKTIVFDQLTQ